MLSSCVQPGEQSDRPSVTESTDSPAGKELTSIEALPEDLARGYRERSPHLEWALVSLYGQLPLDATNINPKGR
jgi:hypothetical protein